MISASVALSALVTLVIVALIFYLIWWFVGYVGLPEPFNKVVRVIVGLCALIYLINFLLRISGTTLFR